MSERLFAIEPWCVREQRLHLDRLAETESIFALANGHIGMRGNLDEGEPHGIPGTSGNGSRRTSAPVCGASTPRSHWVQRFRAQVGGPDTVDVQTQEADYAMPRNLHHMVEITLVNVRDMPRGAV